MFYRCAQRCVAIFVVIDASAGHYRGSNRFLQAYAAAAGDGIIVVDFAARKIKFAAFKKKAAAHFKIVMRPRAIIANLAAL